jgi:glycosyltransferase involved in cell wall biosynthesis
VFSRFDNFARRYLALATPLSKVYRAPSESTSAGVGWPIFLEGAPVGRYHDAGMWNGQSVSVVFPTYNERASIRAAIEDFFASGLVDEIVVVDNNAAPGTRAEVAATAARLVHEPAQGYGHAIRRGLREATGDLIIISEPDGTFYGRDVLKLLAYSGDFEVVLGTRTGQATLLQGANMGLFLKYGNYAVAKLMEFLFNTVELSDVGCTMRLIRRPALERVIDQFQIGGSHFGPEFMLLVIRNRLKFIEIPVHYGPRIGESSVTGSFWKALRLGLQMIGLILRFRLGLARTPAVPAWQPTRRNANIDDTPGDSPLPAGSRREKFDR